MDGAENSVCKYILPTLLWHFHTFLSNFTVRVLFWNILHKSWTHFIQNVHCWDSSHILSTYGTYKTFIWHCTSILYFEHFSYGFFKWYVKRQHAIFITFIHVRYIMHMNGAENSVCKNALPTLLWHSHTFLSNFTLWVLFWRILHRSWTRCTFRVFSKFNMNKVWTNHTFVRKTVSFFTHSTLLFFFRWQERSWIFISLLTLSF